MEHFFNIVKYPNKSESIKDFDNNALLKNVKMYETQTHFYVDNFPGSFGNMQNKNNRVYDQNTLTFAANQFNDIKEKNPYFCYIFDGHNDSDSYESIAGKLINLKIDHRNKCILMDLKLNKGSKSQKIIKNCIADGDPVGASMRIITPHVIVATKEELRTINNNIIFLEDDNKNIAKLMSNDNEIEYITGEAYIQRFDLTQFPSFNYSFISKPYKFDPIYNKSESTSFNIINNNLSNLKEATTSFSSNVICTTNSCKFRNEIKKFVDLINVDKSLNILSNDLYNSMLNFSYINLDQFDFNNIKNPQYLKQTLIENNQTDIDIYINAISNILKNNVLNYIVEKYNYDVNIINKLLINTINKVVDEDNITYQLITLNYIHFIILSTIILAKKESIQINIDSFNNIIIKNITNNNISDQFVFKFLNSLNNQINIYDYINNIFIYVYNYIHSYCDKISPLAIINESLKLFLCEKTLTNINYIK